MTTLTLTQPDDWHLHLRDGGAMANVVQHSAACFRRAIIMPNLSPPVTDTEQALAYRQRIVDALPAGSSFDPLMTLYLTDTTTADEVARAKASGRVFAVKLYPAGATTNSASGVTDIRRCDASLRALSELGLPLLVHGEVTDPDVDVFDRERVFIERHLKPLLERLPDLRVVLEHITTSYAVSFIRAAGDRVAATITPQHIRYGRNALFQGGLRPHYYCLPVLKRESHREAVLEAAVSGETGFFLGTDSAPHPRDAKESGCGCAGIYSAHAALALYAEAFEQAGALHRLEGFASWYGADFYQLPRNSGQITLVKDAWRVPDDYAFGGQRLVPLEAGNTLDWRLVDPVMHA